MLTWKIFVAAIGLALVIEGAVYFALPGLSKTVIRAVLEMSAGTIRKIGLITVAIGLAVFWVASSM